VRSGDGQETVRLDRIAREGGREPRLPGGQ
jgi:hypothetical protein